MIIFEILLAEMIQVCGNEDRKSIQTILLNGLHKPFHIGIRVWRAAAITSWFYVVLTKRLLKILRKLRFTVMLHQTIRKL